MGVLKFVVLFLGAFICSSLGQSNPIIESSQFAVDYADIRWLDDSHVLLLTYDGKVYRSKDSGIHFEEITNLLQGATTSGNQPAWLYPNDVDNRKVYIRGAGSICWVSEDKGATWRSIRPNKLFRNLDWHEHQPTWALAVANNDLWVTQDFGETWKLVKSGLVNRYYAWGDAGHGEVPKERIYMLVNDAASNNQYHNFVCTDDFGTTEHVVQARGDAFLFLDKQVFVLVRALTVNEYVLKVSPDIGRKTKHFFESEFPFGDQLEYNGYTILDDSTGAVFLGVNHGDQLAHWGNIYVSEARGWQYATSVKHAAAAFPTVDFARVAGLQGIYLVNTLENWQDSTGPSRSNDKIVTLITHNNGGSWERVNPPHFDSNHQPITCTGKCSLHLHGYSSLYRDNFGPFYTTENSLGVIVATGNLGDYLDLKVDNANTYLSRDAGITWIEVYKGSTIYEIGDHGSIVVFAPFDRPTTTLYYTLDEGTTPLKSYTFSNQAVEVLNIITEPDSTNERFVIQARNPNTQESVLFGIDFSKVFSRNCSGLDYELWAPDAGKKEVNGLKCLLGRELNYHRRKADAVCFNGDFEKIVSNKTCPCIAEDYECDYEYDRASDGTCKLPDNVYPPTFPPEYCPPGTTYYKSKGYRKITGDTCQGGVDLNGDGPVQCPKNGNGGDTGSDSSSSGFSVDKAKKSKGWIAAVVLVPLVFVLVIGAFFAMRSETLREKLPFLAFLTSWRDGYMQTVDTVDEDQFIEEEEIEEDAYTIGDDDHSLNTTTTSTQPSNVSPPATTIVDLDDAFDPRK